MSMLEMQELALKYDLRLSLVDGLVFVNSVDNLWYFDMEDVKTGDIILYHQSKNKKKTSFHRQRVYRDVPYLFKSIFEHENHMYYTRKKSRTDKLFDLISLERDTRNRKNVVNRI